MNFVFIYLLSVTKYPKDEVILEESNNTRTKIIEPFTTDQVFPLSGAIGYKSTKYNHVELLKQEQSKKAIVGLP